MGELVASNNNELIAAEYVPGFDFSTLNDRKYETFYISDVVSSSGVASGIAEIIGAISMTSGDLYRVKFPKGVKGVLATAKDGSGQLGAILKDDGGLAQARLTHAADTSKILPSISSLCQSLALAAVSTAVNDVKQDQENIINFLNADKEADLKSNLLALQDITENLKYNLSNESYKTAATVKILDIKVNAQKNIMFYKEQIPQIIKNNRVLHTKTDKVISDVSRMFRYYRLSAHLYSFASLMEVQVTDAYDEVTLNGVKKRIEDYALDYRLFYTECYNLLDNLIAKSAPSIVMKGASYTSSAVGKTVGKIPKLRDTQLDETLIENGNKLQDFRNTLADKKALEFSEFRDSDLYAFRDAIEKIDFVYNQSNEMIIGEEKLYVLAE